MALNTGSSAPGAAFYEKFVEAEGFRIRCMQAGHGDPLICLHGAGGLNLTRGHDLLAAHFQVLAFEMPGFGTSPENTRTRSTAELATTMAAAIGALGIDRCNILATSFGARVALWIAIQQPALVRGLVLESPAAIRPVGVTPPSGSPDEIARMLYAHPERMGRRPPPDAAAEAQTRAFVMRVRGPDRDTELEAAMRTLDTPTLALFGTHDRLMPPELGRHYKTLLPNGHLVFVYDAGHAISSERPEAFAEVTVDFVTRHEAFVVNRTMTLINP